MEVLMLLLGVVVTYGLMKTNEDKPAEAPRAPVGPPPTHTAPAPELPPYTPPIVENAYKLKTLGWPEGAPSPLACEGIVATIPEPARTNMLKIAMTGPDEAFAKAVELLTKEGYSAAVPCYAAVRAVIKKQLADNGLPFPPPANKLPIPS